MLTARRSESRREHTKLDVSDHMPYGWVEKSGVCCNRRDVVKHGRDKVAKDKRLSMLAWKYGLEDFRPNEERGRSESNLEPLPFVLGAHHSNYTCLARCLRAVLPCLLYHGTTCSTRTFEDRCKRVHGSVGSPCPNRSLLRVASR